MAQNKDGIDPLKVRNIIAQVRDQVRGLRRDPLNAGYALAELGAMLVDFAHGMDPNKRGSYTRKVRRALGYTYP